jgi:hypothetical protein
MTSFFRPEPPDWWEYSGPVPLAILGLIAFSAALIAIARRWRPDLLPSWLLDRPSLPPSLERPPDSELPPSGTS